MPIAAAIPYVVAAAGVASTVSTINANKKIASAAQNSVNSQRTIANDLKYAPIDIEQLKADATKQAVQNATQSLALERSLQPNIANTREGLARSVSGELAQGGNLPPDIANKVAMDARTVGARSGSQDNAAPITASLLGLTSLDLLHNRQAAASNLLAQNPLQPTGLDPGAIASVEVAQNAAQNQFNLEKAGINSNLARSQAGADASQIGANASIVPAIASGLTSVASLFRPKATGTDYSALTNKTPDYSLLGNAPPVT